MPAVISALQERAKGMMRLYKGMDGEGHVAGCRSHIHACVCVCLLVCVCVGNPPLRIEIVFLAGPNVLFTEC